MFLVLLAIVPAIGVIIYAGLRQRREDESKVTNVSLQVTRLLAGRYDESREGVRQLLGSLATLDDLSDVQHCNGTVQRLVAQFKQYSNLGVADLQGNVICSALPLDRPVNLADSAYFRQAVATGVFAGGDFQAGLVAGRPTVGYGYPLFGVDGRLTSVVIANLDLAWLGNSLATVQVPPNASIMLFDSRGTVLARFPDGVNWTGKSIQGTPLFNGVHKGGSGTFSAPGLDGMNRFYGFKDLGVDNDGPFLTVGLSYDLAYASADSNLRQNLVLVALAALLALIAAWFFGDFFLVKRIRVLAEASRQLASGDLAARSGLAPDQGELGQLARSFDGMAVALQERQAAAARAEAGRDESEARFRGIFENVADAMIAVTLDGIITLFNPAAEEIFGYKAAEVVGTSIDQLLPLGARDGHALHLAVFATSPDQARVMSRRRQVSGRCRDGREFPIEATIAKIQTENGTLFTAIVRDVTQRIALEREMRSLLEDANAEKQVLERTTSDLTRTVAQLNALYDVFSKITDRLSTDEVVKAALDEAVNLVDAEVVVLRLLQDDELAVAGSVVRNMREPLNLRPVRVGEGLIGRVAEIAKPIRVDSGVESQMLPGQGVSGAQSGIAVPVMIHGSVLGTLGCWSVRENAFDQNDERLLEMMASQIAAAISAAKTTEESQQQARLDPLTGVANRLQLSEDVASSELLAGAERSQGVVVMLDIDHFKQLNDSLGHQFGDRTLQRVAAALRTTLRDGDRLYRYGGEEFLIVFAGVSLEEAACLCESVRETIGSMKLDRREGDPALQITVSLGLASFPTHEGGFAEAIGLADQAMYEAKREGRNRVATWDPSRSPRAA